MHTRITHNPSILKNAAHKAYAEVCKILLQYYFGLFLLLFYCPSFLIDPNSTIAIVKIVLNSIATIANFGENNELNLHTTEKN